MLFIINFSSRPPVPAAEAAVDESQGGGALGDGGETAAREAPVGQETTQGHVLPSAASDVGPPRERAGPLEADDGEEGGRVGEEPSCREKSSAEENPGRDEGERDDVQVGHLFKLYFLFIIYSSFSRESLRISVTNLHEAITPTEEKDRFKKFQEAEKKRYRAEQQR